MSKRVRYTVINDGFTTFPTLSRVQAFYDVFLNLFIVQCLEENASSVAVVKSTFSFLRQLAGNDDVKQQFSDAGWLQIVKQAISNHIESPGSMEQALGFITAICLRNPEVASAVLHSGLPEIVLEVSQTLMIGSYRNVSVSSGHTLLVLAYTECV